MEQTVTRGNNQTTLTVTVQNQFPSGETLDTVTVTVEQETRDLGTLHSGDAESARFVDVDCEGPVLIEASGDSVSAQLDREECTNLES